MTCFINSFHYKVGLKYHLIHKLQPMQNFIDDTDSILTCPGLVEKSKSFT